MLNRKRFELALEKITPSDWRRFEEFASAFLSSEFSNLRSTGTSSGDGGRDAELHTPEGEPTILLQYSVTDNWEAKIKNTAKKIKKNFPLAKELIYVTNLPIGAKSDKLRSFIRKDYTFTLDIRDQSYFMDRFEGDDHRETVAANLARDIVDVFLESRDIIEKKAQALTPGENRAALVFLELQWEDDSRDKGLTKTAFDALVRTALRSTNDKNRMPRENIHKVVCEILPGNDGIVILETNKSLTRLQKSYIGYHAENDEFHLRHEESERIKSRLAEIEIEDKKLRDEIATSITLILKSSDFNDENELHELSSIARVSIESFLLQRGELFVSALEQGQLKQFGADAIRKTVEENLTTHPIYGKRDNTIVDRLVNVVVSILTNPGVAIEKYLRDMADAYTLMAFLHTTPDVQSATKKMFSVGEIWLDTSIILPLFAEDLVPTENWQFKRLIFAAKNVGLKIKVSPGVIEEVERHMNRAKLCSGWNGEKWRGDYPYLFASYIASGADQKNFSTWISQFVGNSRPEDDISYYLESFFNISTIDIAVDALKCKSEIRYAVKEAWNKIHNERRNRHGHEIDPMLSARLAEHDTDNYVGVIVRRQHEGSSAFGYTSWWLTLDHMAFEISEMISPNIVANSPPSPVMSADFLSNYLAFGPLRGQVERNEKQNGGLPVAIDPALVQYLTPELVALAKRVREESVGLQEHVIRRKVRDSLDEAKRRTGSVTRNGLTTQAKIPLEG